MALYKYLYDKVSMQGKMQQSAECKTWKLMANFVSDMLHKTGRKTLNYGPIFKI